MKKHLLQLVMICFVIAAALSLNAGSAKAATGYEVDSSGTLSITGDGAMEDYTYTSSTQTCTAPWYSQKDSITKIVIASNVTSIGKYAFRNLSNVTSVTISSTVTSIGYGAFCDCTKLTSVTIPSSVETLGNYAFAGTGLTGITVPSSVTSLGQYVFNGCTSLKTCTINASILSIPNNAFNGCTALTTVNLPTSIASIGTNAFYKCSSLTSFTFTPSVRSIYPAAFAKCTKLSKIYFLCDAPSTLNSDSFTDVKATAYYISSSSNSTWTSDKRQNYGGTLTWSAISPSGSLDTTSWYYDGKENCPTVTLKCGDYTLVKDSDYTVSYSDNVNAGTGKVTVTGMGVWGTGTLATYNFTIEKAEQTGFSHSTPTSKELAVGMTYDLSLSGVKENAAVTYSTTDTTVGTITSAGKFTALKTGTVTVKYTIAATSNYKETTSSVSLTIVEPIDINNNSDISGSTLYPTSYTYSGKACEPYLYKAGRVSNISQVGSRYRDIDYTLTYSNNINAGTATVTITGINYYCGTIVKTFTINQASQSLSASASSTKLYYGSTAQLTVTGQKSTGALQYSSDNEAVATVNSSGLVTAVGPEGTATITVTAPANTNYKAGTATVTITVARLSQTLVVSSSSSVTLDEEDTSQITVTGNQTELQYSSNKESVATVDNTGKITAVGYGTAAIIVKAVQDNVYSAASKTISVKVNCYNISHGSMSLSQTAYSYNGSEKKPTVSVTLNGTTVSSNYYDVVYADNINAGTATVTVTGKGTYKGTLSKIFWISQASQYLKLNKSSINVGKGDTETFTVTGNNTTAALVYSSSDPSVAAVDDSGKITGVAEGTATITVTAPADTNFKEATATLSVTVKPSISGAEIKFDENYDCTYWGGNCRPGITVTLGDTVLTETTDYTVKYIDNNKVGIATVNVEGTGTYAGHASSTFIIRPNIQIELNDTVLVQGISGNYFWVSCCIYNGSEQKPSVQISGASDQSFTEGTDYDVVYSNNTNVGSATAAITFKGSYSYLDPITKSFHIAAVPSGYVSATLETETFTYDGLIKEPAVTVTDNKNNIVLTEGKDYDLTYSNNLQAVIANVTITLKGNYEGTLIKDFFIQTANPALTASISQGVINEEATAQIFVTGNLTSAPLQYVSENPEVATVDANGLVTGVGYGTTTIHVTAPADLNCAEATADVPVTVNCYNLSHGKLTLDTSSYTYDGTEKKPSVTVELNGTTISSSDYDVVYTDNINVGTATVTITGKGLYSGTLTQKFTIDPLEATVETVPTVKLSTTVYTYTGGTKSPTVSVMDSNGKSLVRGTDYTFKAPSGRQDVGKYTYVINFIGNYSGSRSLSITINPKGTAISKVTAATKGFKVTWKKYTKQTTGYVIRYSTSAKMKKAKKVTVTKNTLSSKSVTKLKSKKKYYIQICTYKTVNGVKYYSAWSKTKTVTTK